MMDHLPFRKILQPLAAHCAGTWHVSRSGPPGAHFPAPIGKVCLEDSEIQGPSYWWKGGFLGGLLFALLKLKHFDIALSFSVTS